MFVALLTRGRPRTPRAGRLSSSPSFLFGALLVLSLLLLLLLLLGGEPVGAASVALATPPAAAAGPTTTSRTVMYSGGRRQDIRRHKHRMTHPGDQTTDEVGPKEDTNIIKAPRRFVPQRASPTCSEGQDVDHKGKCRVYW